MTVTTRFFVRLAAVGSVGAILLTWCALTPLPAATEDVREEATNGGGTNAPAAAAVTVELESKPLPRVPAGTEITRAAPKGWSHFLMIAVPTLTKQDAADAPKTASHYAQMFKFTLLAQTEKTAAGYQLAKVARGFAMDIRGKEIVVESKKTFGGKVGMFGDRILAENEKHIDADVRQVAKTPTMIMFDAQAVMRQGNEHVRMVMRHAVVLDPANGKPYTLIWLLSKTRDGYLIAEKELQLIPEGTREPRYLSVKRDQIVLGIPKPEAFALIQTPKGTEIKWAGVPALEKVAAVKEFTREQVLELERQLLAVGRAAAK